MHSSANLRAAQAIVSARQRLLRGRIRDAAREATQPLTLRQAEERFPGSKRATIARIIKKLEAANSLNPEDLPDDRGGRPRLLTDDEEEAIVAFVVWMQKSGLPASKYEVEDAANTLRRRRDPDAKSVSRMWYRRFCDDHPELDKSILKAKEASRVEYEEAGVKETKQWFQRLTEVITNYKIGASECWNADQAGVRVGILRERVECLVVRNAAGDTTPPWLIFKSFPTLEWAQIEGDSQIRFAQSDTAFSNAEITLQWAKHFNRYSWEKSATVQRRGLDFEQYFGCNEHLQQPRNAFREYDLPPNTETIQKEGPVWRLLVIDGFAGHGSFAFREYCMKFNILVAFLLPHSTHILQPMDVGVFQYLKNAHQRKLREALRKGKLTFNRRDFAGAFQEIFNEGFTRAHIISGFEKSGIFPPTDRPAVEFLLRKKLKAKKTVNPAFLSLLPSETRFTTASATAQRLRDQYHDILSSPTRQGLMHIQKIVNEAILLEKHVLENVNDRRTRIEKRYYERKRGKRAQGASDYINTISLQELREQQDEYVAESQKKSIRSEIRQQRSQLIRELEALKQEWRDNREVTVEGITKKLQFKKWLEVTGKKNDYLCMDTQRSAMTEALNEVTDGFMIDTQHPPDLRESIRNAAFAAKPLEAVDFSLLPHSDDSVTFHLTRPEETPCPSDFGSNSEVVMPSSPPCLPDYESPPQSSLPSVPSTPCPSQHQIQYRESLRDLI
ncbi:hypothetical protein BFJ69_g8781 [Fusarium oxysporum]|uniref:HTH CENPB-type domain-containing protein n=1 Tax=Fusarium oxysporum TaxID=5507 RepID=A0A420N167_FUSOX|nr:hypothetical protein BFJ69_g8781 [Fusarium oxysporum]